jgi:hypothetical protein
VARNEPGTESMWTTARESIGDSAHAKIIMSQ